MNATGPKDDKVKAYKWVVIILAMLTIVIGILCIVQNQSIQLLKKKSEYLMRMKQANDGLTYELAEANKRIDEYRIDLNILNNPDFRKTRLSPVNDSISYHALVFWNQREKSTYVSVRNLPFLPIAEQFQLWALEGADTLDLGLFETGHDFDILQELRKSEQPKTFIVTKEKRGGAKHLVPSRIILKGKRQ